MRRKYPSAATVISFIALFVALGGTAGAASGLIGSAQIKDRSIQTRDLAAATVKAMRGQRGRP